jgi:hypothetical protein
VHAPDVQAGSSGDLRHGDAIHSEPDDLPICGRTKPEHPPAQFIGLHELTRAREQRQWLVGPRKLAEGAFPRDIHAVPPKLVDERWRVSLTRNARRCASSANRQPASRNPRNASAHTDCTTSIESNLALSRADSFLRTTIRR